MNRREAEQLVGTAWLDSDYRTEWETRIMRRRVPLYRVGIAALRALNALTGGPNRSVEGQRRPTDRRWGKVGQDLASHRQSNLVRPMRRNNLRTHR